MACSLTAKQRFDSKWKLDPATGCWLWTACLDRGYGRFCIGGRGRTIGAHRAAWLLYRGPIPEALWVLHACDLRHGGLCVRPEPRHLFLGTPGDNARDMAAKERVSTQRLSAADVIAIRKSGDPQQALADRYGVSQAHISRIVRGIGWSHMPVNS